MSLVWMPLKLECLTVQTSVPSRPSGFERQRLNARLFSLGLSPVDVRGDGNCQFRAIAHQLFGDENFHEQVRMAAVSYIQRCRQRYNYSVQIVLIYYSTYHNSDLLLRYEPFMSRKYNLYLKQMASTDGGTCSWGDHLTLDAIANVYNMRVWCIESSVQYECTRISPENESFSTNDIYVGHIEEWHYVSVTSHQVHIYCLSKLIIWQLLDDSLAIVCRTVTYLTHQYITLAVAVIRL